MSHTAVTAGLADCVFAFRQAVESPSCLPIDCAAITKMPNHEKLMPNRPHRLAAPSLAR